MALSVWPLYNTDLVVCIASIGGVIDTQCSPYSQNSVQVFKGEYYKAKAIHS